MHSYVIHTLVINIIHYIYHTHLPTCIVRDLAQVAHTSRSHYKLTLYTIASICKDQYTIGTCATYEQTIYAYIHKQYIHIYTYRGQGGRQSEELAYKVQPRRAHVRLEVIGKCIAIIIIVIIIIIIIRSSSVIYVFSGGREGCVSACILLIQTKHIVAQSNLYSICNIYTDVYIIVLIVVSIYSIDGQM